MIQVLIYLAAGILSVPLAKRAGLGALLGYLIAGILIGPHALQLVGSRAEVMDFADLGVVILLFLIGLELKPALLWQLRGSIFGLGATQVAACAAAIFAVAWSAGLPWRPALIVGAVLAMSSTAIVLGVLDERGLRRNAVGTASFGVLLFQDLAVIPLFALLPLLSPMGAHAPVTHGTVPMLMGVPRWEHALAVFAAVAVVIVGGRYLTRPAFRYIASANVREIFTATALLLVLGVATLMQFVGLSQALGAFLAGVVLAESEFRRELEADIEPFRGLLLGLFFMTVGAGLDIGLLVRQPLMLLTAVAGLMALKTAIMFPIARLAGLPARDAGTVAVALSQGGEFAFVLVGLALASGALAAPLGQLLNTAVALSMVATPLVVLAYERLAARPAAPDAAPTETPVFEPGVDAIVAGYGRFGQVVGRLLEAAGHTVSVMDLSMSMIDTMRALGRRVNYGDATRLDLLYAAGAGSAKLLVIAIDDRERAIELVEIARQNFPHLKVLARAWDRRDAYNLLAKGADHVERETFEGSISLGRAALRALGMRAHRAQRAAALFRAYDIKQFDIMRARWGEDRQSFLLASRQSYEMLGRVLEADLQAIGADSVLAEWDTSPPPPEP